MLYSGFNILLRSVVRWQTQFAARITRTLCFFLKLNSMTTADWLKIVSVIVAAIIAVGGWIFTYFNRLAFDRRSANLERINKQLRELYGPLYAQLEASSETWGAFAEKYWPEHGKTGYFAGQGDASKLTDTEKQRWITWMTNVFQPLNTKTAELIIKNIDLIEGSDIPPSFLSALAHINAYNAILAQWESGDDSEFVSVNNWPYRELMADVKPIFDRLRKQQLKLLGTNET